jgi:hypothetical protein
MWTWNLFRINGPVRLCGRKTEHYKFRFVPSTCVRQATMFSNIFSLAWHIKNNLFICLFSLFLSFLYLFRLILFSFRFLPLYLLIHFGLSLSSFVSISFHSLFPLISLTFLLVSLPLFHLDLILVLFFLYSVASSFVLFRSILFSQSKFVHLQLASSIRLHSIYVLGTVWTAVVKMRILDLVIYFWFT